MSSAAAPGLILDRINGELARLLDRIGTRAPSIPARPPQARSGYIGLDPTAVRIRHGRIKLPGVGWVKAPGVEPPLPNARLTRVEGRIDASGWVVHVEAAAAE